MLNIKEIRTNTNYIIESLKKRNFYNPEKIINEVLKLDKNYRKNLEEKENSTWAPSIRVNPWNTYTPINRKVNTPSKETVIKPAIFRMNF